VRGASCNIHIQRCPDYHDNHRIHIPSIHLPATPIHLPSTSRPSPVQHVSVTQSMIHAVRCDAKHNWYQCLLRCYVMSVTSHGFIISSFFDTRIYRPNTRKVRGQRQLRATAVVVNINILYVLDRR